MNKARLIWQKVHLWLALGAGIWMVVLGLSGSLLVYHRILDRQLNLPLLSCRQPQTDASLDKAYSVIRLFNPDLQVYSFYRGTGTNDSWRAYAAHPTKPNEALEILFCPFPGEVLGTRGWATGEVSRATFFSWVYSLHYTLLLRGEFWGNTGQYVVGGLGFALILSVISGAVLWWPRGGKWRQALWFKSKASSVRRAFDIHRIFGYLSLLPLLLISLTGIQMSFSQWINPLIGRIAPLHNYQLEEPLSDPAGENLRSLDELYRIAHAVFPEATFNGVSAPGASSAITFTFLQPEELRAELGTSRVWVDSRSGNVLQVRDPLNGSVGDDFLEWMFPLHNGEVFGHPGRVIVLIAGLSPTALLLTGLLVWNRKRSKGRASPAAWSPQSQSPAQIFDESSTRT